MFPFGIIPLLSNRGEGNKLKIHINLVGCSLSPPLFVRSLPSRNHSAFLHLFLFVFPVPKKANENSDQYSWVAPSFFMIKGTFQTNLFATFIWPKKNSSHSKPGNCIMPEFQSPSISLKLFLLQNCIVESTNPDADISHDLLSKGLSQLSWSPLRAKSTSGQFHRAFKDRYVQTSHRNCLCSPFPAEKYPINRWECSLNSAPRPVSRLDKKIFRSVPLQANKRLWRGKTDAGWSIIAFMSLRADKSIDYFLSSPNVFLPSAVINYFLSLLLAFATLLARGKKTSGWNGEARPDRNSNYVWCTRTFVQLPKNVPHFSLLLPKLHFACKMGKATRPCFRAIHQRALSLESRRDRKKKKRMGLVWRRSQGGDRGKRQFYLYSPSKESETTHGLKTCHKRPRKWVALDSAGPVTILGWWLLCGIASPLFVAWAEIRIGKWGLTRDMRVCRSFFHPPD